MKQLSQRFKSDCLPTCVAMIARITHTEALKIVHPKHKRGQSYATSWKEAERALTRLGLGWTRRKANKGFKFSSLREVSIVSLGPRRVGGRFGHAVVWDPAEQRILDPFFKRPRPLLAYQRRAVSVLIVRGK